MQPIANLEFLSGAHINPSLVAAAVFCCILPVSLHAQQPCANPIACENLLPGTDKVIWDLPYDPESGEPIGDMTGDMTIQGFSTDISVNAGQMIDFKISVSFAPSAPPLCSITIYRLGYYGGKGAREVAVIPLAGVNVQTQPDCLRDPSTGLIDCGNWQVSASWLVPPLQPSGVYLARLVRTDTNGASHIPFIVRNDGGTSDLLFQTADATWQAYNDYANAGNRSNLYAIPGAPDPPLNGPGPGGRGYKVSYNRPIWTRNGRLEVSHLFWAEYPMIRWIEANGYNVKYISSVDPERLGSAALTTSKVFLSVGHDEYWSGGQRANVEAALGQGVHLAFFSGNEIFWKTRWEPSIAGPQTAYRTLVCYKETEVSSKVDPSPEWTGTWRDPRFSPPSDGGRPENALTGQLYTVGSYRNDPIVVSAAEGKLRFWRNTGLDTLAPGEARQLPRALLGFEWDEVVDNGFLPRGLVRLSTTTTVVDHHLRDYGTLEGYERGPATHHLTLYRHGSGALVFGAGTLHWSWGLDSVHDNRSFGIEPEFSVRQATVNLFADMGVQPTTLQADLIPASAPANTVAPTSVVVMPAAGATVSKCATVTIRGTASANGGGRPAAVEFSADGGVTWHRANGTDNWTAEWNPVAPGPVTIKSRAVNDSGWIENAASGNAGNSFTVVDAVCPASTNVALATAGAVASASTIYSSNYPVATVNDNERIGRNPNNEGFWADRTDGNDGTGEFPDWVQVSFDGRKRIDRVVVYTLQDNFDTNPVEPTDDQSFSAYGIRDFTVQGWDGSAWVTLATVTSNNLVKRTVTFPAFNTERIRINISMAMQVFSRVTEIEAWGTPIADVLSSTNVALASAGAVASASTVLSEYRVAFVNDNERTGLNPNDAFWVDGTANANPDWVRIDFDGMKVIDRVVVYTLQDIFDFDPESPFVSNRIEPTDGQFFSLHGITDFTVEGWDGVAWTTLGTVANNSLVKCTVTFPSFTTDRIRITVNNSLATYSRITEIEAWGTPVSKNVALSTAGAVAVASSVHNASYPVTTVHDNERIGRNLNNEGFWADATANTYPDWVEIEFDEKKIINRVAVYTLQDNFDTNPVEPTDGQSFSAYGIRDFTVQGWDGSDWVTLAAVTNNNLVKRTVNFPSFETKFIRVHVTNSMQTFSRITEIEAWGLPVSTNVALASAAAVASASSVHNANYPVETVHDNERIGRNPNNEGFWADATANTYPDWVQIDFNRRKAIDRVVVYTLQDDFDTNPVEPTDGQSFSAYGIRDFTVQGWDGSAWVTLAAVTNNNLVKRTITFPSFNTERIRINVSMAMQTFSRITELEAWGTTR
jgi:hypothetical protein